MAMEYVSNFSSIIPVLVDYFSLAKAGPYHPLQVRNDLKLSQSFWRVGVKAFVYPEGSEGRKALESVGVSVVTESATRLDNGKLLLNALFLKKEPESG